MIIIYPIYVKDSRNYNIVKESVMPRKQGHTICFVVNGINREYLDILHLADKVIFNDYNIVAKAWNLGIYDNINEPVFCVVNQDLKLTVEAANEIYTALNSHDFVCHSSGNNSFSCFGITKKCYLDVGNFDETFKPAYYEDNDYHYRLTLKGYKPHFLKLNLNHVGSSVIKHDADARSRNNKTFRLNGDYYRKKWGGQPGQELFKTPFNE